MHSRIELSNIRSTYLRAEAEAMRAAGANAATDTIEIETRATRNIILISEQMSVNCVEEGLFVTKKLHPVRGRLPHIERRDVQTPNPGKNFLSQMDLFFLLFTQERFCISTPSCPNVDPDSALARRVFERKSDTGYRKIGDSSFTQRKQRVL